MLTFHNLAENFRFLVLEVADQVEATHAYLGLADPVLHERIVSRDDHIDNLKVLLENLCFATIHAQRNYNKQQINLIRARHTISVNLERIADFCVNIIRQTGFLKNRCILDEFHWEPFFEEIRPCFPLIIPVLEHNDLSKALVICQAEMHLDDLYKQAFDRVMGRLRGGREVEDLVTLIFIFRYLERIGDSLLNIGEALLAAIIGEKIKITQFDALQKTLSGAGVREPINRINYESYLGTRSGCNISRIDSGGDPRHGKPARSTIFKGGQPKKIKRERENLAAWQKISPGLVPQVISFHEETEQAAMLVEFIAGPTMDEVVLGHDPALLEHAFATLEETLPRLWDLSKTDIPAPSQAIAQLLDRLDRIRLIHPRLFRGSARLNERDIESFTILSRKAADLEKEVAAPCTVFIHGDCNANNIVFNQANRRIHFIDVYRSQPGDYLQDMAVLLVSFFRLPVFEAGARSRLNQAAARIHRLAASYAAANHDQSASFRLALHLARSFFTSVRFELNARFAREMLMRGHYLLEKVSLTPPGQIPAFTMPEEIIYY